MLPTLELCKRVYDGLQRLTYGWIVDRPKICSNGPGALVLKMDGNLFRSPLYIWKPLSFIGFALKGDVEEWPQIEGVALSALRGITG